MGGKRPRGFLFTYKLWGPAFWRTMHCATFRYPVKPTAEERRRMLLFMQVIAYMIPCGECGAHYVDTLNAGLPLDDEALASRDALTRWLVKVHNAVNARLGKPQLSYSAVERYYILNGMPRPGCGAVACGGVILALVVAVTVLAVLLARK